MKHLYAFGVVTLGLSVALSLQESSATMLEQLDTTRLTQQSNSIHIGQVTESWSSCSDENCRMIYTYVKLHVEKTLKGNAGDEILIRVPGGQVKDKGIGIKVHGMASFTPGERTLVFLQNEKSGTPSVVGMAQGKYHIYKSPLTGVDMAAFQAPSSIEFFTRGERGQVRHVVSSQVDRKVPLEQLIHEIQDKVGEGNEGL